MKLDVVIVNYNVCYFLEQALHSVERAVARLREEGLEATVWVVDNASVDGSVAMVRAKFPWVALIANADNRGFARANNQAIRQGTGAYVLLLNPDTVVEETTLLDTLRFMDAHPQAGGLGVRMLDGKGRFLPESKRGLPTPEVAFYKMTGLAKLFPRSRRFGRYHLGYLDEHQTHEVEVLAGAFMLLRRRALEEVGLLDEAFFMYGEDIDLSYRLLLGGYRNYYFPQARIIHYKGESTRKASVNYVLVFYRAMILFAQKHFSSRRARAFKRLIEGAIYLRAALALAQRLARLLALPLLDAALFYTTAYGWARLYAAEVKENLGYYHPEVYSFFLPAIVLLWMLGLWLAGAYRRPFTFRKTLRGLGMASVVVIGVYAFLPEGYRFSRALILTWPLVMALVAHLNRVLARSVEEGKWRWQEDHQKRILIVGSLQEAARTRELLYRSMPQHRVLGTVAVGPSAEAGEPPPMTDRRAPEAPLGRLAQMEDIIQIHRPDELIFCSRDLPSRDIIEWMVRLSRTEVYFKMVPDNSLFIIGSDSRNSAGDFYTLSLDINLARPEVRRMKRALDVVLSLALLLLSPLLAVRVAPRALWRSGWQVLLGRRSWVGYGQGVAPAPLPPLQRGIFTARHRYARAEEAYEGYLQQVDWVYARDYRPWDDVRIVWRNLRRLPMR
jgi:GT2 family glycosyltransferase